MPKKSMGHGEAGNRRLRGDGGSCFAGARISSAGVRCSELVNIARTDSLLREFRVSYISHHTRMYYLGLMAKASIRLTESK